MTTLQNTPDIRQNRRRIRRARRQAHRAMRVMCRNFRAEAKRQSISVLALRTKAGVAPFRMLGIWTGTRLMLTDMFRLQHALGMSVSDLFDGTPKVSA